MFAVAAGLLMATSCSNEREEVKAEGEAVVTFVAEVPNSVISRAPKALADDAATFGDGTTATNLQYAVYKVTDNADGGTTWTEISELSGNKTINISTTVSLKLVNGQTYAVAFWAEAAEGSIYSFDKTSCKVTANYENVATSNESLDAFYAVKEFTVNGSAQETVELYRPFAQLNIGTGDLAEAKAAGYEITKAGVKVKTYSELNLKNGEVEGDAEEVTFAQAVLPTADFPVMGYNYLTMNYLLMPVDKEADNTVTISYDNANVPERVFNNVPLQRNYRTNIYGNLLTSTTDFTVIIKPEFDGEDNNVEIWDGVSTTEPAVVDDAYVIKTPSEWAWLCKTFTINKNIELAADLDFGDNNLGFFQLNGASVKGNGYTLKNMKLVGDAKCNTTLHTYNASLFFSPSGTVTISDLTVKGAKVVCLHEDRPSDEQVKGHAAVIIATIESGTANVTLKNVHVIGADVYGIQPVAGLVGRTSRAKITIDGCSVEDSYLHNIAMANESGFVATIMGRTDITDNVTITNTVSKNNTIEAYYAARRGEASIQEIAHINIDVTGVTKSDNTVTKTLVPDVTVNNTEELLAALAAGNSPILLNAGTYEIGGASFGSATEEYTLIGADKENSIVKMQKSLYVESAHKLTLKNLTLNIPTGLNYPESEFGYFQRAAGLTVSNCHVNGGLRVNCANTVVENCDFTVTVGNGFDGYAIYYYGANNSKMTVNNCTFDVVKKGIVMYAERECVYNLDVNDCIFTASTTGDKCAIQMHTEKGISGTLNIKNTTATGFYDLHGGLWQDVNNDTGEQTKKFTVTVDGKTVQTAQ